MIRNEWYSTQKIPNTGVFACNMKWLAQDKDSDYSGLLEDQYINHFQNNKEITSKSFLNTNLNNYIESEIVIEDFYPKCYDFSFPDQLVYFKSEYFATVLFIILKKHIIYFRQKLGADGIAQIDALYQEVLQKEDRRRDKLTQKIHTWGNIYMRAEEQDPNFIIDIILVEFCLSYFDSLYRQIMETEDQDNYFPVAKYGRDLLKKFYRYSQLNPPYEECKLEERLACSMAEYHWATPHSELILKLYRMHKTFEERMRSWYAPNELCNVWVVKPASNARGQGIYVTNKLHEILPKGKKGNQGNDRIVMKYIEHPLLFPVPSDNDDLFEMHKFDIRQWVLLKSLDPLEIYIFSGFYGRLCSKPYSLDSFNDSLKHLSNYSLNKSTFKKSSRTSSVIEDKVIKDYIKSHRGVDWDLQIAPKIRKIIIASIESCKGKMKPRPRSFEIFGFDLLIDDYLNPWLLEVNLSPACAEREKFLTEMLDNMVISLFTILQKSEIEDENSFQEALKVYKKSQEKIEFIRGLEDTAVADMDDETYQTYMKYIPKCVSGYIPEPSKLLQTSNGLSQSGLQIISQSKVMMKQSTVVNTVDKKKPIKLVNCLISMKIPKEDLKYYFIPIVQKLEKEEKTFSKGQEGYFELPSIKLSIRQEKRLDQAIKNN